MSREQRARDSWPLLFAQGLAREAGEPLAVVFCLAPRFLGAAMRQYGFMLDGLKEAEAALGKKDIPMFVLTGEAPQVLPGFIRKSGAGAVVTDFDPLRIKRRWKEEVMGGTEVPFYEVDGHNIVPCWLASPKQEFAARTLRPRIKAALPEFLDDFPALRRHPAKWKARPPATDWRALRRGLRADGRVAEVGWLRPGEGAAMRALRRFIRKGLARYGELRNDPSAGGQSGLSPYLHFGHLSAQRAALEASRSAAPEGAREAFLEELIIRRELSDNYCFYNSRYDSFEGLPRWARATLDAHRRDPRRYLYGRRQFEEARTHDELWNAAQTEMLLRGKMHGYMRMYWAKKILEWSPSPEEAFETAIYLNDRYELDGRDPNGYAGIAWSLGGLHDRPWPERPIFGKVRYMGEAGLRGRFDAGAYLRKVNALRRGSGASARRGGGSGRSGG